MPRTTEHRHRDPPPHRRGRRALITGARERIDALDDRIIALVQERMGVSADIQRARIGSGGRRVNLARETEILARYRGSLGRPGTALAMTLLELCRGRGRESAAPGRRARGDLTRTERDRAPTVRWTRCPASEAAGSGRTTRGTAGAMRRTARGVRRGTSLRSRDRTAGDSSPVTQETAGSGTPGAVRRQLRPGRPAPRTPGQCGPHSRGTPALPPPPQVDRAAAEARVPGRSAPRGRRGAGRVGPPLPAPRIDAPTRGRATTGRRASNQAPGQNGG